MQITNDRRYIIADAREIDALDFSQFLESKSTVLYNIYRTKFLVKYEGSNPSYAFMYPTEGPFNIQELNAYRTDSEWPYEYYDYPQNP